MRVQDVIQWRNSRRIRAAERRSNDEWLALLRGAGRDVAIEDLRLLLLRGLRIGLKGKLKRGQDELLEDFVQESLVRILDRLDTFRGESRFTTWAYKASLRAAFSEMRRKRWQDTSLDDLLSGDRGDPAPFPDRAVPPDESLSWRMAVEAVERAIAEELTERQRKALTAVMVHGMEMEEVARQMGMNRNALYKLIHDARKSLKSALIARGLDLDELLSKR